MITVEVALPGRSYPIHIGSGLLAQAELILPHLRGRQVMVVSNPQVAGLYLPALRQTLEAQGLRVAECLLPDGEAYKDLEHLACIFDRLLAEGMDRRCTVLALGGGVVGDMAGFAAATYQRGVNFIQVPTSLLAQVDSSVGGKTGVNHPRGKNMIGAFKQPALVLIDIDVLATLPKRELAAGMAEIIKYALIRDREFLDWLDLHAPAMMQGEPELLAEAVARSCRHKAEVVLRDEFEEGERALLNLGHTFGHAIETHCGYGNWLHGEAVAAGMVMAARMSQQAGDLSQADVDRILALLQACQLPSQPPAMHADDFQSLMAHDKKVLDGRQRLVLQRALGHAEVVEVKPERLRQALQSMLHA